MPNKQPRPPLSPIAEELRARAVSKRGISGTLKLKRLLELDAVVEQAGSEEPYRLSLAFETLLVEVVDRLDSTFSIAREQFKSPAWIARGLFRLDPSWPEAITSRRARIVQKYPSNVDHFRQTYEKDLYEHVAVQLEGWQVAATPESDPSEWPWDHWMQTLLAPLHRLYDDFERGLHDPVPSNGVPTVATSALVEDWVAFLAKFEAGDPSNWGVISGFDLKRHLKLEEIATFLPLTDLKRQVIVIEFSKCKARGVPFTNYLERGGEYGGRDLHAEWIRFLDCCKCGCAGDNRLKRYQYRCVVHKLLYLCEWSLEEYNCDFVPYWETRLSIEEWPEKLPDSVSRDPSWPRRAKPFAWPARGLDRFIYPVDLVD